MSRKYEKKRRQELENAGSVYQKEFRVGALTVDELVEQKPTSQCVVRGRVMLADSSGKISEFGTNKAFGGVDYLYLERLCGANTHVEVIAPYSSDMIQKVNSELYYGDIICAHGRLRVIDERIFFVTEGFEIVSKAIRNIYDKNIHFDVKEHENTYRYLQLLRSASHKHDFQKISRMLQSIRMCLYDAGFHELNLSLLSFDFEGGLARPFSTYVHTLGRDMYLRLTAELQLRKLMIAGFEKVFEISKSFRNQDAARQIHPEFTILELYQQGVSARGVEELCQSIVGDAVKAAFGVPYLELVSGQSVDFTKEWARVSFHEYVYDHSGFYYDESGDCTENLKILDSFGIEHPKVLEHNSVGTSIYCYVMSQLNEPTFLQGLPAATSPLNAYLVNQSVIDETLLVIDGMLIADLVNAERDPVLLEQRLLEQQQYKADSGTEINHAFIDACYYGLPPCRGIGMGLERLFMFVLGKSDIRDVEFFPIF